jgi:general stress protein 26
MAMAIFDDNPKLAEFLNREPVAVVSVSIDEIGTPHAATLGYWHKSDPLSFFFVTNKNSQKCRLLNQKKELPAACVVGTYMGTEFTLQMRGTLRVLDKDNYREEIDRYCEKRGKRREELKDLADPDGVLLRFTPNWARYVDFSQGWGQHFLELNNE